VLGRAVKSDRVVRNVATFVDAPAKARPHLAPLSAEDAQTSLAATWADRAGPLYGLRHATATLLIEAGEELGVVSKILGHSNLGTTADIYAHLTPRDVRAGRGPARHHPPEACRCRISGTESGTAGITRPLGSIPRGHLVLRRVVGAERFERSTS